MQIKQHIPAAVSGVEPDIVNFKNLEELLQIPFVKKFESLPGFYRFSLSEFGSRTLLMAELNKQKSWWVVGRIEEPFALDLPKWETAD